MQRPVVRLETQAVGSDVGHCIAPEGVVAIHSHHLGRRPELSVQAPRRCSGDRTFGHVCHGNVTEAISDGVKLFCTVKPRLNLVR